MMKNLKEIFSFFWRKKNEEKRNNGSEISLSVNSLSTLDEKFLFDFRNYQAGSMLHIPDNPGMVVASGAVNGISTFVGASDGNEPEESKPIRKIAVKPIDVLNELETVPTPWDLSNLDDKIEILRLKTDLITQYYAKREVEGLIERLQNRKKWAEFRDFFESFKNTTDEKIENLLGKYDLVMKDSDLFIPEFPDDAIKIMKSYTEEMEKLCGKKPVFYVIAEPDKFRKAYEKRDPILLVQSPFGFYWQILGAWDKEMLLLSEL